jgi:phosphoribosyl-AMP cyclohydrolase
MIREISELKILELKYDKDGLIPAVVQDDRTGEVLMMAWMNAESLKMTVETGYTHFWSRSRKKFWKKGEESGHVQEVKAALVDCDCDTLLVKVVQHGPGACHTGHRSCFFRDVHGSEVSEKTFSEEEVYGPKKHNR